MSNSMTPLEAHNWIMNTPGADQSLAGQLITDQQAISGAGTDPIARAEAQARLDQTLARVEQDRAAIEAQNAADQAVLDAEQAEMDLAANKATCDCLPHEPCCFTHGKVFDSAKPGRKVVWPSTDGKTRLLVIAKDLEGADLIAKVKSEVTAAKACTAVIPIQRGINTNNPIGDPNPLPETTTEQNIRAPRSVNFQSVGANLLPGDFVLAMMAVDTLMTAQSTLASDDAVTYRLEMCQAEAGMGTALRVQAMPKISLEGEAKAFVKLFVGLSGFSASSGIEGSITGEVGQRSISATGEATAESGGPEPRPVAAPQDSDGEGNLGFVQSMLGKMADFAAKGEPKPDRSRLEDEDDLVDAITGTGVEFTVEVGLKVAGLALTEVDNAPDLKLDLADFETWIEMKAEGIIDLIQMAVAILLTPAAARTVQSARAAASRGETFRGEAKCDVTLGASGKLEQKYSSGFSYLYSANEESGFQRGESSGEFGGAVSVTGDAEISIHVEARVWIATAQAGARGALHTAWTWEMRKHEGRRQKRFYFEGLRARATAYAEIGMSNSSNDPVYSQRDTGGRDEGGTPGITVDGEAEATQTLARVGGPTQENWSEPVEGERILLEPTVPRVTGSNPPWEDY